MKLKTEVHWMARINAHKKVSLSALGKGVSDRDAKSLCKLGNSVVREKKPKAVNTGKALNRSYMLWWILS